MTVRDLELFAEVEGITVDEALSIALHVDFYRGARIGGEVALKSHGAFLAGQPIEELYGALVPPENVLGLLTGAEVTANV